MKKWNKNKHQGKRKDQIDYSNKTAIITWILMLIIILIGFINKIFGSYV